jgi:hypothetical protein
VSEKQFTRCSRNESLEFHSFFPFRFCEVGDEQKKDITRLFVRSFVRSFACYCNCWYTASLFFGGGGRRRFLKRYKFIHLTSALDLGTVFGMDLNFKFQVLQINLKLKSQKIYKYIAYPKKIRRLQVSYVPPRLNLDKLDLVLT